MRYKEPGITMIFPMHNWIPSVQYNISYNNNNDREVYDVSFWDIDYQTWSWAYHYIYTYYETLNEIYGYFVDGDSPGDPFWYSGTDIDANGLATHTVYQVVDSNTGYFYNTGQRFYTHDENGNRITNLYQSHNSEGPIIWRDENLWTMEYSGYLND